MKLSPLRGKNTAARYITQPLAGNARKIQAKVACVSCCEVIKSVCDVRGGQGRDVPALTIRHLHLPVANQLAREEGLGVSMLNQCVLQHLHHTECRLQKKAQMEKMIQRLLISYRTSKHSN